MDFKPFLIFLVALFSQFQVVSADAGDIIAILLGVIIAIVGFCAFLGWWSRRGDSSLADTSGDP